MRYMLLIVEPVGQRATRTHAEGEEAYALMKKFGEELQTEGKLLAVESLASTQHATRLQVRGDKRFLVDGPFAEAKEMVGGFFLVECAGPQEALALAERCPAAQWATVEVRPAAPCFDDSNA